LDFEEKMAAEGEVIACHTVEDWTEKLKAANESKKLIVIDFTATWCPPCRFIAPVFADLAKKHLDVVFFKVDVDELNTVAEEFKVQAMPTFIFMKEGEIKETVVGAAKEEIIANLEKHKTVVAAA
jgi:thioredoxin 1